MRILLVDDHVVVREGVAAILSNAPDLTVVGQAGDSAQALRLARTLRPDVVLMDICMPDGDGVECGRRIKEELPDVKIVMLTAVDSEESLAAAVAAGASGYLLKNLSSRELIAAIRSLGRGESPLTPSLASKLFRVLSNREPERKQRQGWETLSAREIEVLRLVAQGLAYKEVADRLGISENTVKNHIQNVIRKLSVENRIQAVTLAVQQGIVPRSAVQDEGYRNDSEPVPRRAVPRP